MFSLQTMTKSEYVGTKLVGDQLTNVLEVSKDDGPIELGELM